MGNMDFSCSMGVEEASAFKWWEGRRRRYNVGLFISGPLAFVVYATIVFSFEEYIPDAEISGFTIALQSIGYLLAVGLANIFYFLGPLSEKFVKPKNLIGYRESAYKLGFWFSVLLPFAIPLLLGGLVISRAWN